MEVRGLAPPLFSLVEGSTVVTVFKKTTYANMTKEDRVRACYQHASLRYLMQEPMSNLSLRERLGLNKNHYPQVSNVIADAIELNLVKPLDVDQGNRNARYVPYWA